MSTDGSDAPLIRAPSEQTSINMGTQRRSNNQAFTAYMAYSQKQQLSTLERRSDRLQEINRKSVMRAPLQMHLPMSSLALTYEEEPKEKDSSSSNPKPELTQCQKEASGEVKSLLPSFHPRCDENGDYLAEQCWDKTDFCWCVDKNGVEMPDSLTNGTAKCQDFNSADEMVAEPLLGKDGH
uniref:Uncharacterized LOC109105771 n=1 Tax=Cyprinus carpio TaxID=7962 RepID=A0A8C1R2Y3_CYPCA